MVFGYTFSNKKASRKKPFLFVMQGEMNDSLLIFPVPGFLMFLN
jgi:hypothetical protein